MQFISFHLILKALKRKNECGPCSMPLKVLQLSIVEFFQNGNVLVCFAAEEYRCDDLNLQNTVCISILIPPEIDFIKFQFYHSAPLFLTAYRLFAISMAQYVSISSKLPGTYQSCRLSASASKHTRALQPNLQYFEPEFTQSETRSLVPFITDHTSLSTCGPLKVLELSIFDSFRMEALLLSVPLKASSSASLRSSLLEPMLISKIRCLLRSRCICPKLYGKRATSLFPALSNVSS